MERKGSAMDSAANVIEKAVRVKICGLTTIEDAGYLNEAGADYAGFVFFPKSKRNLTLEKAKQIAAVLDPRIKKVAVTVSPDLALAKQIEEAGFDLLQVHKELSPELLDAIKIPVWYAFNVSDPAELEEKQKFLEELPKEASDKIEGIVVDAANFGSGETFDWAKTEFRWRNSAVFSRRSFILAGGLSPENVAEGIRSFAPDVVDVSSKVEGAQGKDREKVLAFCRNAKTITM